jgi:hypothetical protein
MPLGAVVIAHYWAIFVELLRTPFEHVEMVWGIVPLYFGWMLNELTSSKASFRTAVQTGFTFLWAGAHWSWQYLGLRTTTPPKLSLTALFAVNVLVTVLVMAVGLLALVSGLRRRFPPYGSVLGHSRFSAYFMIAIFPIQSNYLAWSWERLLAILLFAAPIWLAIHLGQMAVHRDR